jgi:hypothetical protein
LKLLVHHDAVTGIEVSSVDTVEGGRLDDREFCFRQGNEFSFRHSSGVHPASCPVGFGGSFAGV